MLEGRRREQQPTCHDVKEQNVVPVHVYEGKRLSDGIISDTFGYDQRPGYVWDKDARVLVPSMAGCRPERQTQSPFELLVRWADFVR